MKRQLIVLGLFWSQAIWASPGESDLLDAFEASSQYEQHRTALIANNQLTNNDLSRLSTHDNWEIRLQAQIVSIWRVNPERASQCWTDAPGITRNGMPRFAGEPWRGPDAAPLLIERFIQGNDDTETRAALIAALQYTKGDWSQAVVSLFAVETEERVREVMADVLRYAESDAAWLGLSSAAQDDSANVRSAAMRSIGSRSDGAIGAEILLGAMTDPHAGVRAMAARSTGWLEIAPNWNALRPLISDENAEVRLHALRSMKRIDAVRTAQLTELHTLQNDTNDKVRRLATGIAQ